MGGPLSNESAEERLWTRTVFFLDADGEDAIVSMSCSSTMHEVEEQDGFSVEIKAIERL